MSVQAISNTPTQPGDPSLDHYLDGLDRRVTDLDEWIDRAAFALMTFKVQAGFRRNTTPVGTAAGTTSTSRSLFALHEYRRFLLEEERPIPERLNTQLRDGIESWIFRLAKEGPKEVCEQSENGPNRFTYSHMLLALKFTAQLAGELDLNQTHSPLQARLEGTAHDLATELRSEIESSGKMGLQENDEAPHHFITLHGVRAIDAAGQPITDPTRIRANVAATVLEQLGYHSANVMARFDPGALVFATALLGRFKAEDRELLTDAAVKVAANVQTDDGAWLSEQVVAADGSSRIYVSSYEVGLGLTQLSLRELAYGNVGLVQTVLPCLERVMELIRASYVSNEAPGEQLKGWANDRSRWPKLIESWATASVLSFMLRYRMVLQGVGQQLILARYGVSTLRNHDEIEWPDLDLAFPPSPVDVALRQIESQLGQYTDPSEDRQLTKALREKVLRPVVEKPGRRPDKASLIFYGPPGSRKTSLVKQMGRALGWPVVVLSPPDFLGESGLDGFEGSAARIFKDLMRLRRTVILFDECEDFFKPRRRSGGHPDNKRGQGQSERPEARTIGAFLTAGMLPRLQRLRDNRWVIFILATNIEELDELDEAVRRPGRFDFADELRHPKLSAQQRYITEHRRADELAPAGVKHFQDALAKYCPGENFEMPFAVIDYVVAGVLDDGWPCTAAGIAQQLQERMEKVGRPPSLMTSVKENSDSG